MKKLFKSLVCISLVFILSVSIASATDGDEGDGMCSADYIIQEIAV